MTQFQTLKVVDPEARIFEAVAVARISDNQGRMVKPEDVKPFIDTMLRRSDALHEEHSNRKVGKVLDWWDDVVYIDDDVIQRAVKANPDSPMVKRILQRYKGQEIPAIGIRAQVFKDWDYDDTTWQSVLSGEFTGISLGSRTKSVDYDNEHQAIVEKPTAAWEFSLVKAAAVCVALIGGVNELAQSDAEAKEFLAGHCAACGHNTNQGDNPMTSKTEGVNNEKYTDKEEDVKTPEDAEEKETAQEDDSEKPKEVAEESDTTPDEDTESSSENEEDGKDRPSEDSEKMTKETKQADEAPEEAPAAAEKDELVARLDALEERLAAVESSLVPEESEGEEEELVQEDPGQSPGDKDPADAVEAAASSPDENKELKQSDNVKVTTDARGEEKETAQSNGIDAAAVARGEFSPSFSAARGQAR